MLYSLVIQPYQGIVVVPYMISVPNPDETMLDRVYGALSTGSVLTSEFVEGVSIDKAFGLPQEVRDAIARTMLVLTMRELFAWRLVQSDPNFGNYLYDHPNKRVYCIDFGAARTYPEEFVRGYMELVWAAGNRDRPTVLALSRTLGFLTGDEHADMLTAHIDAALVVGEPFVSHEPYDFGSSQLTKKISQYGGTFMKYRLTPPPSEAYSLHRKLAGAFLLCIKLKARIPCRDILEATYSEFKKASEEGAATASSAVQA
jgi:aarF domain-containing kinase